ncbi:hypothetical protein DIPPA_26279 [Diplonema papillatum]|nr:hypothetical protein DIPPA_26279 [Diplonema papillatum]|eukprot:gene13986-21395_t
MGVAESTPAVAMPAAEVDGMPEHVRAEVTKLRALQKKNDEVEARIKAKQQEIQQYLAGGRPPAEEEVSI